MFVMKWYARNIQTKPKPPSPPPPLKKNPENLENFRVTCFIYKLYQFEEKNLLSIKICSPSWVRAVYQIDCSNIVKFRHLRKCKIPVCEQRKKRIIRPENSIKSHSKIKQKKSTSILTILFRFSCSCLIFFKGIFKKQFYVLLTLIFQLIFKVNIFKMWNLNTNV